MKHDRRTILKAAACGAAAALLPACATTKREEPFDLVIHGGLVVDGNGKPPRLADVGVRERRIAYVGAIDRERSARAIDATGLIVAPGFVDMHSHSDRSILTCPTADSRVLQGYTCEITGNCGASAAPAAQESPRKFRRVSEFLHAVEEAQPSIHQALLVGHGTLRENKIGAVDRPLTESELADVSFELELALDDGAFGLSSGLEYVPGIYTPPAELVELAKIVARRGRMYASHMRSEDAKLVEAVDEALTLARTSGVRTQISHLKSCGRSNWHKVDTVLARIEAAVRAGLDVRADVYPYTAYSTTLTILLSSWAREGEKEDLMKRLADPTMRARMRAEVLQHVANEPGGFDLIAISSILTGSAQGSSGKTVAEIAAQWGIEPVDAYLRLLEEEQGSISYVGHAMQETDVARILAHPLTMIGSDGTVQSLEPEASVPHPRSFGTAPRVLGRFVRELKSLSIESAVRKLAALPAERARIPERGRIEPRFHADLVIFDAATIADRATFAEPRQAPVGIEHVLVAGESVVEHGKHTGARPGSVLTPAS